MLHAPIADCPYSCFWFTCQFFPATFVCTQMMLRNKFLEGDMSKYMCFQGVFGEKFCCVSAGNCGEKDCPQLCLFCESLCCNACALSATRIATMQKYDLRSDPCDYRLIYINNALQCLSLICDVLAIINGAFQQLANIIDLIAELFYHTISGCMTAQVAHELNYQLLNRMKQPLVDNEIHQGGEKPYEHHHHQGGGEQTHYPAAHTAVVVVVQEGGHTDSQQQTHNV
jgi:hypothetical protein